MELTTILNRCHHFRGLVYEHACFSTDKKSIEVVLRPRKGSAAVCSRCHLPAPGYDQLAERRFEFIPLWGFFVSEPKSKTVYDGGHLPPVELSVKVVNSWLDETMGAVAPASVKPR
jgi:hypothetical protein